MNTKNIIYASLLAWIGAVILVSDKMMAINVGMVLVAIGMAAGAITTTSRSDQLGYAGLAIFFGTIVSGMMLSAIIPLSIIIVAVLVATVIMFWGIITSLFEVKPKNASGFQTGSKINAQSG